MKENVIKQLHELGIYRDPSTKQKLENMKLADILSVMSYVQEEIEKGTACEPFLFLYMDYCRDTRPRVSA